MPNTNGFEIDWIVNPSSASPTVEDLAVDGHERDAEPRRVGAAQLGDVGGDLAVVEVAVLLEQ